MTTWVRRFLPVASVAVLAVMVVATPAVAQPELGSSPQQHPKPDLPGGGTDMFRYMLHLAGVKPVTPNELHSLNDDDFADIIVVVIGSATGNIGIAKVGDLMDQATQNGGAVLIASESNTTFFPGNQARTRLSVRLSGLPVVDPRGLGSATYHNNQTCPYVVPVGPDEPPNAVGDPGPIWGLFAGLDRVATNNPSYFIVTERGAEFKFTLARFHRACGVRDQFGTVFPLPPGAAFALGGEGTNPDFRLNPEFRFVALADQSVFINQMLAEPDADNFELARRTVFYLADPQTEGNPKGVGRKRCIFVENGRLVSDFRSAEYVFQDPLPMPSVPPLGQIQDKLVDLGNSVIDRIQTNDALNKGVFGSDPERRNRRLRELIAALLVIAAVVAMITLVNRARRVRQPLDTPVPPSTGKPAGADPVTPAGIFDRRTRELSRRDNVYEPARDVIREMFAAAGAPPDAGPRLPRVEVTRVVRRPETLRRALAELWQIGYGAPTRLGVREWEVLEPLFIRAKRALDDGKWRFAARG